MVQFKKRFPQMRVLAVEDYNANNELLEGVLLALGCEFDIVDNHSEALDLHANHPFDIILLAALVPDMDVADFIKRVHAMPAPAQNVHIFSIGAMHHRLPNHVTDALQRPFKIHELEQLLLRWQPRKVVAF